MHELLALHYSSILEWVPLLIVTVMPPAMSWSWRRQTQGWWTSTSSRLGRARVMVSWWCMVTCLSSLRTTWAEMVLFTTVGTFLCGKCAGKSSTLLSLLLWKHLLSSHLTVACGPNKFAKVWSSGPGGAAMNCCDEYLLSEDADFQGV